MIEKQVNYIEAEKDISKEVKIHLQDNGCRDFETIKDLIKTIEIDKKYAEDNGLLEEYLNQKVSLQLVDIEGQIVTGDMKMSVGWSGEKFVLCGNIESVDFIIKGK